MGVPLMTAALYKKSILSPGHALTQRLAGGALTSALFGMLLIMVRLTGGFRTTCLKNTIKPSTQKKKRWLLGSTLGVLGLMGNRA